MTTRCVWGVGGGWPLSPQSLGGPALERRAEWLVGASPLVVFRLRQLLGEQAWGLWDPWAGLTGGRNRVRKLNPERTAPTGPYRSCVPCWAQGWLPTRAGRAGTAREEEVGALGSTHYAAESPAPQTGK